jgi:hypothetical protein
MFRIKDFLVDGEFILYMRVLPECYLLVVTVDPLGSVWTVARDVNDNVLIL